MNRRISPAARAGSVSMVLLLAACGSDRGDDEAGAEATPSVSVRTTAPTPTATTSTASALTPPKTGGTDGSKTPPTPDSPTADPVQPVIDFGDRTTNFERPFAFPLGATSQPPIPLEYQVLRGAPGARNDESCIVTDGVLSFEGRATLAAVCMVEVSAPAPPAGYLVPEPAQGLVSIDFPSWDVDAPSVPDVSWSTLPAGKLVVSIAENSGDAFGVVVEPNDACNYVSTNPPDPSPAGTTSYDVTLQLKDPTGGTYTCDLLAVAKPDDYTGGQASDPFTVTVVP